MRKRNPKFGAPGKLRPAVFALKSPKASAPRLHQRNVGGRILLTGCLPKTQAAIRCGGSAPATPDSKEKPSRRRRRERAHSRFLRSQPRRIGLGSACQARPRHDEINISWVVPTTTQKRNFLFCLDTAIRRDAVRRGCHPAKPFRVPLGMWLIQLARLYSTKSIRKGVMKHKVLAIVLLVLPSFLAAQEFRGSF